ncbi:SRPBCC family protein [Ornithinimicrobium sp. W1665]|uniref:SRPBCC family protein n=1 Tax=Ornithinimicrobium sp. W1665 TaxID=3416666 RepID=UPI003CF6E5BF
MARPFFELDLLVPGSPEEVWTRLWDLDRHTRAVPLTAVQGPPPRPGSTFVARTAVGPVGFDDVMEVREWDPPHRAVVVKVGRVVRGRIEARLTPDGAGRTRVRWRQEVGAAGVPRPLARLAVPAVAAGYRRSLRRILEVP